MGWTTRKEAAGTFGYELWSGFDTIHTVGGFATMQEANEAGCRANTRMVLYGVEAVMPLDDVLSDDALLAELLGEPKP
jgi:hypothetical protein